MEAGNETCFDGSGMAVKTIGIIEVAALAITGATPPPLATITATCMRTSSAAIPPCLSRAMAIITSRRVRDAGMGGLVQQSAALEAHRQHAPKPRNVTYVISNNLSWRRHSNQMASDEPGTFQTDVISPCRPIVRGGVKPRSIQASSLSCTTLGPRPRPVPSPRSHFGRGSADRRSCRS